MLKQRLFHVVVVIIVVLELISIGPIQSNDVLADLLSPSLSTLSPGLLLTTSDTIAFIYPKEMFYENDYLHVVLKLNDTCRYRIEDSVYDNKTWSIYFVLSEQNANSSSSHHSGSSLIRLKQQHHRRFKHPYQQQQQMPAHLGDLIYEVAPNWHMTHIFSNETSRMLSLDLNSSRRKLYWFEFDRATRRWSLGLLRLVNPMARSSLSYHMLNIGGSSHQQFSSDGYSYLAVASDSTVFVSNNQSLIVCHLDNETCYDYFRPATTTTKNSLDGEHYQNFKSF